MTDAYHDLLKSNAQELRRNMTKEERRLWYDYLKDLPVTVNRQKMIGPYIVDFYIASAKLVIELDGSQHNEQSARENDAERDNYLKSKSRTVLRFSNLDINYHFDNVCETISRYLR